MSTTLTDVAQALQTVFTSVADTAARDSGFVQRQSKLTGNVFVQTLTFGWLDNPQATLEELAQTATTLGVPISAQGLDQRFGPRAGDCLLQVLHEAITRVVTADPVAVPILQRFPGGVCLLDSTILTLPDPLAELWPGCGGTTPDDGQAALKLHVRFNLLHGMLAGPFLHPGRVSDKTCDGSLAPLPAGSLRLADLGFFSLDALQTLDQQGIYWLTRWQPGTALYEAAGQVCTLAELLTRQTADAVDLPLMLGVHHRLPCRLVAVRVPPHVAAKRRQRLEEKRRDKGRQYRGADHRVLTEWTVYITNVPSEMLSAAEVLVLARCRWQVELLFKLWKSEGHIDESRSGKPWRVLCEVYAKLLGMVVQHWLLLVSCWSHADRSLVKASRIVRRQALPLAIILAQGHLVRRTLLFLKRWLSKGCRINKRRKDPPTHQLLLNLPKAG
jgi:hypothetical protein